MFTKKIFFALMLIALLPCSDAKEVNQKPLFLADTLLPELTFSHYPNTLERNAQKIWQQTLADFGLFQQERASDRRYDSCNYSSALQILRNIDDVAYQKIWVENQVRVFMTCSLGRDVDKPQPVMPQGDHLPQRAFPDYLYQLASWYFYQHQWAEALNLYQQCEQSSQDQPHPFAGYMVARTLAALGKTDEAYHKIEELLKAPDLPHRDMIENYRFVLMNATTNYRRNASPDLANEHLSWLLDLLKFTPEKTVDQMWTSQIRRDAMEQLQTYFFTTPKPLDDWLQPEIELSPTRHVVREMARTNPQVDWLQAQRIVNIFDIDWLWALHDQDNPYWEQNRNIVNHAWRRWQQDGYAEWLEVALSRVHPDDPLAKPILNEASFYLEKGWQGEPDTYHTWLMNLSKHAIRLLVAWSESNRAITIGKTISNRSQALGRQMDLSWSERDTFYFRNQEPLRWYVYHGRFDEARKWWDMLLPEFRNTPYENHWQTLLASDWDTVIATNQKKFGSAFSASQVWKNMLHLLPTRTLHSLALDTRFLQKHREQLSRTVFTRAVLLESEHNNIKAYATLAANLNPAVRELILQATAHNKHDGYIDLLLQMPRFRPLPYLSGNESPSSYKTELFSLDNAHPNDNNWWCRFDKDAQQQRVFQSFLVLPREMENWSDSFKNLSRYLFGNDISREVEPYIQKQREQWLQHPYQRMIDNAELDALANIPSAPQYLSESVIARRHKSMEQAASLHRAVRTTRYGCHRDGSHAAYSYEAFRLLHKRYGNSVWAEATPYWFK